MLFENQPPRNVCLTVLLGLHILIVWDNYTIPHDIPARYATLRQAEMTLHMFAWDELFYYWGHCIHLFSKAKVFLHVTCIHINILWLFGNVYDSSFVPLIGACM